MELVRADMPSPRCPRCDLELNPWLIRLHTLNHCPRCAYDLNIIDVSEDLADPQVVKRNQGIRELCDLCMMIRNWSRAYRRLVGEKGVDWSLPHEMLDEVAEQMLPYVGRLTQTGYFIKSDVLCLGDFFREEVGKLIKCIEVEEDLMRLTGGWTDNEQEIKEYWEERFSKAHGLTFQQYLQVSVWHEQRQLDDQCGMQKAHAEDSDSSALQSEEQD